MRCRGVSLFAGSLLMLMMPGLSALHAEAEPVFEKPPVRASLYERLGGEAGIRPLVDDFVMRGAEDPKVNFTRRGMPRTWSASPENVTLLKEHLVQFIASVSGGPQIYEGKDMVTAHAGFKISHEEFDAFVLDLEASLKSYEVSEAEREELMALMESTRLAIVEES